MSGEEKGHPSLSFYFDNDLFAGSDEQYTNGGRLAWLSSNYRFENLPSEVRRLGKLARLDRKEGWMFNYGFSLTQLIFTPEDVDAKRLIRDDRPYAGWLGFGFSVHAKRADVVHSAELNLGMVGPAALGEEAQNGVHRMRGFAEAEGWDNQLSNEFAMNLFLSSKWRFSPEALTHGRWRGEFLPRYGIALGNVETSADVGFTVRWGYNLPNDFANQRLDPTAYNQQFFIDRDGSAVGLGDLGFWVQGGAAGKAVGRDIFLDGNTFSDSHSVDKEYLVGELELGAGLRWGRFKLGYTHTLRTEQWRGQDDVQYIGSVALSYGF